MKLHHTAVKKLVDVYTNYGGYAQEARLREMLDQLDFAIYEQKADTGETVLVMSEDLQREARAALNIPTE